MHFTVTVDTYAETAQTQFHAPRHVDAAPILRTVCIWLVHITSLHLYYVQR